MTLLQHAHQVSTARIAKAFEKPIKARKTPLMQTGTASPVRERTIAIRRFGGKSGRPWALES